MWKSLFFPTVGNLLHGIRLRPGGDVDVECRGDSLPPAPCHVDKESAFYGTLAVNAEAKSALWSKIVAASTQNRHSVEAAEKVPLNYGITCILCLANIIATC